MLVSLHEHMLQLTEADPVWWGWIHAVILLNHLKRSMFFFSHSFPRNKIGKLTQFETHYQYEIARTIPTYHMCC